MSHEIPANFRSDITYLLSDIQVDSSPEIRIGDRDLFVRTGILNVAIARALHLQVDAKEIGRARSMAIVATREKDVVAGFFIPEHILSETEAETRKWNARNVRMGELIAPFLSLDEQGNLVVSSDIIE